MSKCFLCVMYMLVGIFVVFFFKQKTAYGLRISDWSSDVCSSDLEPEVTTAGDMGRMVITILGMVADMELKFIKDRQRAGIEAARAEGVYKGRKKNVDDDEIRRRLAAGASKARVARDLKVSRMTVYRAL